MQWCITTLPVCAGKHCFVNEVTTEEAGRWAKGKHVDGKHATYAKVCLAFIGRVTSLYCQARLFATQGSLPTLRGEM